MHLSTDKKENNVLIFPKLKVYDKAKKDVAITPMEVDNITSHYIHQMFSGLMNQKLVSEKEVPRFIVVKEFISSIILNNHNVYHPFTEIIDEVLTHDVDAVVEEAQAEEAEAPTPKKTRKPRKKKEAPTDTPE